DIITIYNGVDNWAPVLYSGTVSSLPASVTANTGTMTINFVSSSATVYAGWAATWTSVNARIPAYSWSPSGSLGNPSAQFPRAAPTSTTTYTLTASYGAGCIATDQVTVTVDPLTVYAGRDQRIVCGDSVTIGALDTAIVWMRNGYVYKASG